MAPLARVEAGPGWYADVRTGDRLDRVQVVAWDFHADGHGEPLAHEPGARQEALVPVASFGTVMRVYNDDLGMRVEHGDEGDDVLSRQTLRDALFDFQTAIGFFDSRLASALEWVCENAPHSDLARYLRERAWELH